MILTEENQSNVLIDLDTIKLKKVNIAVFGHGNVGSVLLEQIFSSQLEIIKRRQLQLSVFAVANSTEVLLRPQGVDDNWEEAGRVPYTSIQQIIECAKVNQLENLIAIDNTASTTFVKHYEKLVENGFNLVSSNKISNTMPLSEYYSLRSILQRKGKEYLYETNVGAGLPLVDTIKLLHLSGENITRIKGVFSGSLSYLFNEFSVKELPFSEILKRAINNGFTEPDPREDLSGKDVARKLLILARELDLENELDDVSIENLVPKALRKVDKDSFLTRLEECDIPFHIKKKNQEKAHVLRYVGDLHGDLSQGHGAILDVKLISVPVNSMMGQLKGSDSVFEIYTENYGSNPIVIQGAGAGAAVTARGVFGDILRLSEKLN